jgi:hypothetical protein
MQAWRVDHSAPSGAIRVIRVIRVIVVQSLMPPCGA